MRFLLTGRHRRRSRSDADGVHRAVRGVDVLGDVECDRLADPAPNIVAVDAGDELAVGDVCGHQLLLAAEREENLLVLSSLLAGKHAAGNFVDHNDRLTSLREVPRAQVFAVEILPEVSHAASPWSFLSCCWSS